MKAEDLRKRIEMLREQRRWIDNAISILESQLEAFEISEKARESGTNIIKAVSAAEQGSYVLQKVKCGKPSCHCAKPGGELHGPYWYLYSKKNGNSRSKYIGRQKPS